MKSESLVSFYVKFVVLKRISGIVPHAESYVEAQPPICKTDKNIAAL